MGKQARDSSAEKGALILVRLYEGGWSLTGNQSSVWRVRRQNICMLCVRPLVNGGLCGNAGILGVTCGEQGTGGTPVNIQTVAGGEFSSPCDKGRPGSDMDDGRTAGTECWKLPVWRHDLFHSGL